MVVLSKEGKKRSRELFAKHFSLKHLDLAETGLLTSAGRKPNPGQGRIGDDPGVAASWRGLNGTANPRRVHGRRQTSSLS
jgi:hypothetical protein